MDLDSLNLQINADSSKAVQALDNLINKLGRLSSALNISAIDGFTSAIDRMSVALNSINGDNLKKASDALVNLSKASEKLNTIGSNAREASSAISKLAKDIASEYSINDAGVINQIAEAITNVYSSANAGNLQSAIASVQDLVKQYGRMEVELAGVNKSAMDFLKTTTIHLDDNWAKELGDDAKRIRGTIGFINSVREGGLEALEVVNQLNERGANIQLKSLDNNDALRAISEFIEKQKDLQEMSMVSMKSIIDQTGNYNLLDDVLVKLANQAGMTAEQLAKLAIGDNFNGVTNGFQQLANVSEQMEAVGNPFEGILTGLSQLGTINLSDSLKNINHIAETAGRIGGKNGQAAGQALSNIASGLAQLSNVNPEPFNDDMAILTQQLRALGSKNIVAASTALTGVANGLNAMKGVGNIPQINGLAELGKSLAVFGYKSSTQAIQNIPMLASAFKQLMTILSTAPTVSRSVIDLANAMANLSKNTGRVAPATSKASHGIDLFSVSARKAQKSTFSLAGAIGKLYATYWGLFRVFRMFGNSITLASDLTEVQNVVDHTFGSMRGQMEDFAKTSVETLGMSELTAKKIGSRFQAMGMNMNITPQMISSTNDFVQEATNGYADVADSVADVSINLTRLAGDMASFYNMDYEEVAEDLESIYTGMVKPMRQYGVDLTEASLKEWAMANGMNADIKSMTQAEKMMLRYQYVLAHTTAAQGDFIRTQDTWANTIKRAQENLKRLQVILGQIGVYTFKPLVASFNNAMNDIIHLAESALNSLGKIFGWQIEISDVGILDDYAEGLDDISDSYGSATDNAKKFKNMLLGIDELNLLPDNSDKDKGGSDAGLGTASALRESAADMIKTEGAFDSIYDTLFKLGKRINEVELDWLKNIPWDDIFQKARDFGQGFAEFLNGYFSDAELFYEKGEFFANALNTIANALDAFFKEFDGAQFGVDIGSFFNGFVDGLDWDVIHSAAVGFATDVYEIINNAIKTVHWSDLAKAIAEGLNVVFEVIFTIGDGIEWENIGIAISDFVNGFFDPDEGFDFTQAGEAMNEWINGIQEALKTAIMGDENGEGGINWKNVMDGFIDFFDTVELDNVAFIIGVITVKNIGKWVFSGAALKALMAGLKNLIVSAISKIGLGSMIGEVATVDLATVFGAGTAAEIGVAIGTGIIGGIIAAFGGFELGKLLGRLFTSDDQWYKDFKWFGDEGFFGVVFGSLKDGTFWDAFVNAMHDLFRADEIMALLNEAADKFKDAWDKLMQGDLVGMGADILEGICAGILGNLYSAFSPLVTLYEFIVNGLKDLFGIHSPAKSMEPIGENIILGIIEGFGLVDFGSKMSEWFSQNVMPWFTRQKWEELWLEIKNAANSAWNAFTNWWNNTAIAKWWNQNVLPWFSLDTWLDLWSAIQDSATTIWEEFTTWWNDTAVVNWWKECVEPLGDLDTWLGIWEVVATAAETAWTNAIQNIKNIWNKFADWVNANLSIDIPAVNIMGNELSPAKHISLNLPHFDVGGSIPNTGQLFIANESGPEVMANLGSKTGIMNTEQMENAIAAGMMKALAASGQTVQVVLNGDAATFFTAMVKENNNSIMRTGASPLRV